MWGGGGGSANAGTTPQGTRAAASERSDPTQHAKGTPGDCPGPRPGTATRRNVTQGVGQAEEPTLPFRPPFPAKRQGQRAAAGRATAQPTDSSPNPSGAARHCGRWQNDFPGAYTRDRTGRRDWSLVSRNRDHQNVHGTRNPLRPFTRQSPASPISEVENAGHGLGTRRKRRSLGLVTESHSSSSSSPSLATRSHQRSTGFGGRWARHDPRRQMRRKKRPVCGITTIVSILHGMSIAGCEDDRMCGASEGLCIQAHH